jgi:hypothetical protein
LSPLAQSIRQVARSSRFPANVCSAKLKLLRARSRTFPNFGRLSSHTNKRCSLTRSSQPHAATHNLESRLARRLLRAVDLRGSDELLLTQEYLAEMLGARRTTVTLIAQDFQNAGMIKYRRGRIKICDTEKLQTVACECYRAVKSNYAALLLCPNVSLKLVAD